MNIQSGAVIPPENHHHHEHSRLGRRLPLRNDRPYTEVKMDARANFTAPGLRFDLRKVGPFFLTQGGDNQQSGTGDAEQLAEDGQLPKGLAAQPVVDERYQNQGDGQP